LGVCERHFRRLLSRHRNEGDVSLVSGHRGKPSNHRLKAMEHQTIIDLMHDSKYEGFGPTLLTEKLAECQKITVSRETVRQIMIEEGLHRPKNKKKINLHPLRERRPRRGELVPIDGSYLIRSVPTDPLRLRWCLPGPSPIALFLPRSIIPGVPMARRSMACLFLFRILFRTFLLCLDN